ncbi:MAG: hypothetical protein AB7O97_01665 [Planctomycetota bacterium]
MDLLVALLQGASFLATAAALCHRPLWRLAVGALVAAALASLLHAGLGPAERELVTVHTFVGYEEQAYDPSPVHFPTGTTRAAGWQWPLPFLALAALWIALVWRGRNRTPGNPYLLPMLLGWTATAAWLGMQLLAAPAAVVQPFGLERFLWPAGMALAIRMAGTVPRLVPLLLNLALATAALRLPAALFSKLASDRQLGTCLDVSSITDIVNPITRYLFDPPLVSGSGLQQFWLIWAEHLLVFPAFHLMSFSGVAFALWLMHKHADTPE